MQIDHAFAEEMVDQAIAGCAEEYFAGDEHKVRKTLLKGECSQCKCVSDFLARQIGDYLGKVDNTIKVVYQYESANHESPDGIHLLVWVDHKSAALTALTETLESSLAESRLKLGCPNVTPGCCTIDIEMTDDREVYERRGFGFLVDNPDLHAQPVWSRSGQTVAATPCSLEQQEHNGHQLPEWLDPEIIPEDRLIDYALTIERLPASERQPLEHHLTELKVALIRRLISDQLRYIEIAKQWFTIEDLSEIYHHRIGLGRIGGKSAGMLLAGRILNDVGDEELIQSLHIPESFFLGSDLMYIFMAMNGLMHWNDQKYKTEDEIRDNYPQIKKEFAMGKFPPEIIAELHSMLQRLGSNPVIVRSSSQLEDNLGTSFAGKYDSYFCPNHGAPKENLQTLARAIANTYASTFKPDALLYRRSKKLQDYDERMSVLIQPVQGEHYRHYFLPLAAGVAFSHNLYRWDPKIRREDGFVRLVWGLGTRAVERVGNDFPRLVALSHPLLLPDDSGEAIRRYSQRFVDLIDLDTNQFRTLAVKEVLDDSYPSLRQLVQIEQDGYFSTPLRGIFSDEIPTAAITFDYFLRRTRFAPILSRMLKLLEENYHTAVDTEFTATVVDGDPAKAGVRISLLQCRPQSQMEEGKSIPIPEDLAPEQIIFSSNFLVPDGYLPDIRYAIYVDPDSYYRLPTPEDRHEIGRIVGRLNAVLPKKTFICVGPGRWGTENISLGVYVGYADICNAGALIELAGKGVGAAPEPSLGTHFFQDLMEAQIYPVSVPIDQPGTIFNDDFFNKTPNKIKDLIESKAMYADCLRLIEVSSFRPNHHIELIMNGEKGEAVAFLAPDK